MLAFSVVADDSGWQQFERGQNAVKKYNFDVTFVQVKANQLQTFRWLHGHHQQNGALPIQTELEQLISQDEVGTDIFRRNDRVYYASPASP
ncbi:MAG: sigma-E factor regulatory protein RseB domain-containing protein, partial [Rheinheimera sp.]